MSAEPPANRSAEPVFRDDAPIYRRLSPRDVMLIGGVIMTLAGVMASYIVMRNTVEGVAMKVDKMEDNVKDLKEWKIRMETRQEFEGRKAIAIDFPTRRLFGATRPLPMIDSLDIAASQGFVGRVFGMW